MRQLLLFLVMIAPSYSFLFGQAADTSFQSYANRQSRLMQNAYEKRDTHSYHLLLADFNGRFGSLSAPDKKFYNNYRINAYYDLVCNYALLNDKSSALLWLDSCIRLGYYNYNHMLEDSDLNSIRHEARYAALVEPTRMIGDYRYILNRAARYNPEDARQIPVFTYQDKSHPALVTLRRELKLDSIAGQGNEVSRIINLLHWVHYLVPHDGNHGNPVVMNAMNMIAVCKRDDRGLNCRGLATVLNECYLALGIKSRFVTCMPKDSLKIDNDCHVINMVYVSSLKKWIWIDPTNNAYVMNERGDLLSIAEVRDRIIHNQPVIVNPDADWNRRQSVVKENYLYQYMAKNLYMMETPVSSEYDTETPAKDKKIAYVRLLPLDYYQQSPDRSENIDKSSGLTHTWFRTNNPDLFWQSPK